MGKRKKAAKKPQGKKRNEPLPTIFPCLFCNHENSVTVKLDKKASVGQLNCKVCSQQFQCGINYLSAAVDVYSEWVDACDAVAKEDVQEGGAGRGGEFAPRSAPAARAGGGGGGRGREEEYDDDDGFIEDDGDGADGGGYGGEGIVADEDDY